MVKSQPYYYYKLVLGWFRSPVTVDDSLFSRNFICGDSMRQNNSNSQITVVITTVWVSIWVWTRYGTLSVFSCLFFQGSSFVSDYCLVFVLVSADERTIVPYLVKRSRFNPFLFKRSLVSPSSIMPTLSQKWTFRNQLSPSPMSWPMYPISPQRTIFSTKTPQYLAKE